MGEDEEDEAAAEDRWRQDRDRMSKARAEAQTAVDNHADLEELRRVADALGGSLIAAAKDRKLWKRLKKGLSQDLTHEQRTQLNAAIQIDWVPILEQLGYQPPPPVADYGVEFVEALQRALNGPPPDVDAIQDRLLDLGQALRRLSGNKSATRSQLGRVLRRAVRVAGPVVIALGGAAAGTAIALWATPFVGPVVAAVLGELANQAIVIAVGAALDRLLPEEAEDPVAAYRAAAERAAMLQGVSVDRLQTLRGQWADGVGDVEESRRFVADAIQRLFIAWETGLGWPWFTADLADQLELLLKKLTRVRDALDDPSKQGAVVAAMDDLASYLPTVQTQLRERIEHHDPERQRADAIAVQAAKVAELEVRLSNAETASKQADLNLLADRTPGREDKARRCQQAEAEAREVLAQARRRLAEVQEGRV